MNFKEFQEKIMVIKNDLEMSYPSDLILSFEGNTMKVECTGYAFNNSNIHPVTLHHFFTFHDVDNEVALGGVRGVHLLDMMRTLLADICYSVSDMAKDFEARMKQIDEVFA